MTSHPTLTRRGLFRGLGTATVLAGCSNQQKAPTSGASDAQASGVAGEIGPSKAPLSFTLNGNGTNLDVEPRTTLLQALRLDLDVTGPKLVCDRGACGACMVLVDGIPRNSCMMLAHDVSGKHVATVEGLGSAHALSPLQKAFVEHDALQCGFCTSGMLISCAGLLAHKNARRISADDVREAISGNLCRCGTYPNVIKAVLSVAAKAGG